MAAGPTTRIADVVVPEIFTPYTQNLTEEKSRIIQSGLVVRSGDLDDLLAGGGLTFNVPSWKDLDNEDERISTDTSVPFADADAALSAGVARPPDPLKTGSLTEIAIRMNRNNSWSGSVLAKILAGADPMESISSQIAFYWTRRLQAAFIATWNGVIAENATAPAGADTHLQDDLVNDISGAAFIDGVTNFSAEGFLDTALTMGDSMDDLNAVVVHSVVYNRMQKNNLIDFIPDARGEVSIPTFLGREVITDDGMPRTGNVYDSWLFGSGSTQLGIGSPPDATETDRKPGSGNGGGQDIIYSRVMWSMHPTGHAWAGTAADGGPTNAQMAAVGAFPRVYPERKQIKFARLVTRES
jgi:hypothetical protein